MAEGCEVMSCETQNGELTVVSAITYGFIQSYNMYTIIIVQSFNFITFHINKRT